MKWSRQIFFSGLSVLFFAGAIVFADMPANDFEGSRIDSIKVAGNTSLKESQILGRVRSRVGESFDQQTAAEDAERIAELTGVEYSYYNTEAAEDKVALTFVVVERGLIRSVTFEGNKVFRNIVLRKKSAMTVGNYLDPIMAEAGRADVEEFYHKKGYAFAQVVLDSRYLKKGKVAYKVTEGRRVRVRSVTFKGNKVLETKKLKIAVKSRPRKFFFWKGYYSKEQLDKDLLKLQKIYQKKGHLDANIKVESKFDRPSGGVELTFVISEGSIYTIGDISFVGAAVYEIDRLSEDLKLQSGQVYNEVYAESDAEKILKTYQENGFINATVDHTRKFTAGDKIDVEFKITEGERFRIGRIKITGNENTQDKVIRRVLTEEDFLPSGWYNGDLARGDGKGGLEKTLKQTLLAESVTITPVGQTPGQKDAHVDIIEGRTGSIMLGAGIASDSGMIGQFVFEQRNFDITDTPESWAEFFTAKAFRGGGQTLRISLEPGTEVSRYSISFIEPYFQDRPISLNLGSSKFERGRESYDEGRLRGYVGFEKRYKNKWHRSISFRIEDVDVDNIDYDAPKEVTTDKGSNVIGGIRFGIGKNATNDRFNPSTGYAFNANVEPVVGDHSFAALGVTYRKYKTLYEDLAERKTILATKLHGGVIAGNAPVFEKFYAGGSSSIRGFEHRGVSTRGLQTGVVTPKKKDPVGSDWIVLANAEVTIPVLDNSMAALFFLDTGVIDTGGVRATIGAGVQIMIPQWFGPVPMRFELSAPFMKDSLDDTQVFSFSVGRLF